ncbi:MAG: M20/M25/M40 family metallo-hydrolase, partial [Bacteroidota bacterium]
SMPPRKTAIGTLSAAITDLEQQPMKGRLTGLLRKTFDPIIPDLPLRYRLALSNLWLFGGLLEDRLGYIPHTNAALRTTVAPTMFHAGVKENVLPQSARATLNFRIHPDDNIQKVLHYVQNTIENDSIGISVLDGFREPSPITSTSSESYQMMKHTIHEVFPGIPVTPSMFPAATATRHFTDLTDNLLRFRPIRARPDDRGRVHGTDERIAVDNYEEMIAFYIRLIQNATRQ